MTLDDLLDYVNDSEVIKLFTDYENREIGEFDGKDEIPDRYRECEVTDIFSDVSGGRRVFAYLCIEIDYEMESEDEEE